MSDQTQLIRDINQAQLITALVPLPIAFCTFLLTIYHYGTWKMWQLYLVLAIIVWTQINQILDEILYSGQRLWNFDYKSVGLEFLKCAMGNSFTLKPLATLIYALQNYQSVVRFLP